MDRNAVLAVLIEQIRIVEPALAEQEIKAEDSMAAIGLDSMSRQEVLILGMEALGLNLPMVQLFGPRNLGELADLLHAKLQG
ncbi:MAG: phosphopantetheine-binding protein [Sterolibacteriaceae bacterium MAG5]|nr:phosphopantetheine-binding protein [Candidatus Nitricoxidireducens bremensis]